MSNTKLYKDRLWLDNQINVLGKTQAQVARECGVAWTTVNYWYNEDTRNEALKKSRLKTGIWRKNNIERDRVSRKNHYDLNREKMLQDRKTENKILKVQAFNILGGCRCVICGDNNLDHLTIDHIDSKGYLDKRRGIRSLSRMVVKGNLSDAELSNLRVLCFNHNCSRLKEYLDIPKEDQPKVQKDQTELWEEAFNFFGPCSCGISDLKFLTISHIHNDGAERRRNGEKRGARLLKKFCTLGWPDSLKEDFCLECYNCNCSIAVRYCNIFI